MYSVHFWSVQIGYKFEIKKELKVRYKVEVKTSLSNYEGDFFAVTRSHDEFEWLFHSLRRFTKLIVGCFLRKK